MARISVVLVVLSGAATLPCAVHAQGNQQATSNAYDYAVRCVAAASFALDRGIRTDGGKRAYDMAQRLGASMGYSATEADSDIRARATRQVTMMARDRAYLDRTLDECQRLKLL